MMPARPRQPVGAIAVYSGGELRVEQQVPRPAELGEVRQGTPADEQLAVDRRLGVALGGGRQAFWLVVGPDQGSGLGALVDLDLDRAAVREERGSGRVVVEERVQVGPDLLGVVLPGEQLTGRIE